MRPGRQCRVLVTVTQLPEMASSRHPPAPTASSPPAPGQKIWFSIPMLGECGARVEYVGPTFAQHWDSGWSLWNHTWFPSAASPDSLLGNNVTGRDAHLTEGSGGGGYLKPGRGVETGGWAPGVVVTGDACIHAACLPQAAHLYGSAKANSGNCSLEKLAVIADWLYIAASAYLGAAFNSLIA